MLVPSYTNQLKAFKTPLKERLVRVECGAGQNYQTELLSAEYCNANTYDGLLAALVPGQFTGLTIKENYENLDVADIGCPKLDWYRFWKDDVDVNDDTTNNKLKVAIAFRYHSKHPECPEKETAFAFFREEIQKLQDDEEIEIVGHCHPYSANTKSGNGLDNWWGSLYEPDFEKLLECDILLVDNSSLATEWLMCKRPNTILGLLNSPKYRSFVSHGLRFWDLSANGDVIQINPGELSGPSIRQFKDLLNNKESNRDELLSEIYAYPVGEATQAARDVLMSLMPSQEDNNSKKELLQVCYNNTTHDDTGLKLKGEIHWLNATKARALSSRGLTRIISNPDPEKLKRVFPDLDEKRKHWDITNFARLYQVTYARYME